MRAKIQGVVIMEVVVLADGSVDPNRIRITRTLDRGLDEQAVIAVRQWRFNPSVRLGHPVASRVIVELAFTLRGAWRSGQSAVETIGRVRTSQRR